MGKSLEDTLIHTYEQVIATLDRLCVHIQQTLTGLPIWVAEGQAFHANQKQVLYALKHFGPTPDLTPQETYACPGAVACTSETLVLIQAVNQSKEAFKAAIAAIKNNAAQDLSKTIRALFAKAGYTAIKLKQVYRHIPSINYHPRRIAWSKGKHGLHKTINLKEAERLLLRAGQGEHIDVQLAKLATLDEQTRLVIHRNIKPCWVVNIATFKQGKQSQFEDIKTSLPLFYLHDSELELPTVVFSEPNTRIAAVRSDKVLEENPFLPSIHAFRYKVQP